MLVFAMWYKWVTLVLVCSALVRAGVTAPVEQATMTEAAPAPTLDHLDTEFAWKTRLQSTDSRNQNAPHGGITTKSLLITPLICPMGERLDGNGSLPITINKEEHERNLLAQLNALFTSAPATGSDLYYDYDDDGPGPMQYSAVAAPLQE